MTSKRRIIVLNAWTSSSSFKNINNLSEFKKKARVLHLFNFFKEINQDKNINIKILRSANWKYSKLFERFKEIDLESINHKIFPSFFMLSKIFNIFQIKEIYKNLKSKNDILFIHGLHFWETIQISLVFRNYRIFVSHAGMTPTYIRFLKNKDKSFFDIKSLKLFLQCKLEHFSYKYVNKFYTETNKEAKFLSKFSGSKVPFENIYGIGCNSINIESKLICRQKLGLDQHKKIIIFVGRIHKDKGAHNFIEIISRVKKEIDLNAVMIGSILDEKLSTQAKKEGIDVIGPVSHQKILRFYQAADLYVESEMDDTVVEYGGLGVAVTESLLWNSSNR